ASAASSLRTMTRTLEPCASSASVTTPPVRPVAPTTPNMSTSACLPTHAARCPNARFPIDDRACARMHRGCCVSTPDDLNWDDLRYFLRAAQSHTLAGA